ncbi:hypothetical protein FBY10_11020 [Pseudomonas sp. SJZ103]|uniref:hypothetical protein n=1 Tax=unclassified Pseudomonas TaxID=196821 RepID=UPI0011A7E646|nr:MULTISPECIES: hypothetical protein [unclassified Pseudomonas]TWC65503.1 hypothetical protein FBY10_11020 [Pseudomonas sp. SJZ103]TWC82335.1 hypothetical protein FBY08_111199 [Pseudomonas sp. SJZ094]
MPVFIEQLEHMLDKGSEALFDLAGGLYPGKIAALVDDYVVIELTYNDKVVMLHRHINAVGFITGTGLED